MLKRSLLAFLLAFISSATAETKTQPPATLTDDLKIYGQQIQGLSYQEVREDLLSEMVAEEAYEADAMMFNGTAAEAECPLASPYSPEALRLRIITAHATEKERKKLWYLYFYTSLSNYSYERIFTPKTIFKDETYTLSNKKSCTTPLSDYEKHWRSDPSLYTDCMHVLAASIGIGSSLALFNYLTNNQYEIEQYYRLLGAINAFTVFSVASGMLLGVIIPYKREMRRLIPITRSHMELYYWENNLTPHKRKELDHFKDFHKIKATAENKLPEKIVRFITKTEKQLAKLTYRTTNCLGKKCIDEKIWKQHDQTFCFYYNELGRRAGVLTRNEYGKLEISPKELTA